MTDPSAKTDGQQASESQAGIVAEFHSRISALETSNADLRKMLDDAKNRDFGIDAAHVNHVMEKHFFHDRPADDASKQGSG